jgi:hypothetical protein
MSEQVPEFTVDQAKVEYLLDQVATLSRAHASEVADLNIQYRMQIQELQAIISDQRSQITALDHAMRMAAGNNEPDDDGEPDEPDEPLPIGA